MKKTYFTIFLPIVLLSAIFYLLFLNSRSEQEKRNLSAETALVKAELKIYKDSVEAILNRGTDCDSFAMPDWDAETKVKRVAIRNWTAYRAYLKRIALADSVRTQNLNGTLYYHYLNQWSDEHSKDKATKLKMLEQLIARTPELQKIQGLIAASAILDTDLPDKQQEQLDRFSQRGDVLEIRMFEGQMTAYYQNEQDKAGAAAGKQHKKEATEAWEDFLAVNR